VRGQQILAGGTIIEGCTADSKACVIINDIIGIVNAEEYKPYFQTALTKFASWLFEGVTSTLFALPSLALNAFILFFVTFYLLRDGDTVLVEIKRALPVFGTHRERIFRRLADTTSAIIYGYLVIAIIQGVLGALALWTAGVTSWLFWAIVMAVCALIPMLGTGLVWAPAGIILVISGSSSGNVTVLWQGIGLLLFGAVVISSVDNLLAPRLVGDKAGVHPVFVLLGAVGGIALFGLIGFVLGPLCLALLTSVIDIYVNEVHKR
jgi:predicted PurR-regulated permease PerM